MAGRRLPRRSIAARQALRRRRALHLRIDRERERALLGAFFDALATPGAAPDYPIVNIHGVGGVGKSTLVRWAWDEFQARQAADAMLLVPLDIDSDKAASMRVVEFFWFMRMQIYHQLRESLLAFDYVYVKYLEKTHQRIPLDEGPLQQFFARLAARDSRLSGVLGGVGSLVQSTPLGAALNAALSYVRDSARERRLMRELGIDLAEIDDWSAGEIEQLLPQLLAEDLGRLLIERERPLVLVVDGYERLSARAEQAFVESFAASLLLEPSFAQRAGMILLGREAVDWSAHDDPADAQQWNRDLIRDLPLRGFSETWADAYLTRAEAFFRDAGDAALAQQVRRHAGRIKRACCERDATGRTYHPFYLDICLTMIEDHGASFDPARHLGETPRELMHRFFKYMDEEELTLHLVLSLAVHFDWPLVHALGARGVVRAWTQTAFLRYVARHSYIRECADRGLYGFSRLMQAALASRMRTLDAARKDALRQAAWPAFTALFRDMLDKALRAEDRGAAEIWLDRAGHMLMQAARTELVPADEAYETFCALADMCRALLARACIGWHRAWSGLLRARLGAEHPCTRHSLAAWADSLADLIEEGRRILRGDR
ncbi:MAG: hypothetical protein D6678_02680 [Zetaproteobacteria bacterium]|nr:MAG: hypothetical protein D6678_02680 [Zetaproteobacteria bacterium]